MRCLDCGNKAKKDCLYYRCRSCCKSHGFQCQTHIKSTWVPISTRQVVRNTVAAMVAPSHQYQHQQQEQQQLHLSSPSPSGHFPPELSGEAMFTRLSVTTTSEGNVRVDQYAYETTINIGGRAFRGILYDQGASAPMVNSDYMNVHEGDQQSSAINIPSNLQPVNNPGTSASTSFSTRNYP